MKLYFSKGACSLVVRIIINEIGLDCEYESIDIRAKKTQTGEDYLSINPKGAVPAIQLKDGKLLTENAVILQYLADTSNASHLLPSIGDFNRYRVLEWLNYITTDLHKGIGIMFNPKITQDLRDTIFIPIVKNKFNYINKHLQNHRYLAGDHFTLPDAYLFVMMRWAANFHIDLTECEHLVRYSKELSNRPSIQASLKQEG